MNEYSIIGKSVPRVDAVGKVTGGATYASDLRLPRMLAGKILRSPYPHAQILNIDTSRAERLPGVKAVITAKDTGDRKIGMLVAFQPLWDQTALCIDKVRYIGDEVAAVAAVDEDTAQEALDLIRVEYKELPALFDPLEAMAPGAPLIHEGFAQNISIQTLVEAGDVEQGFKDSYRVFESRYETQYQAHCAMELHTSVATYADGRVTLWTTTQGPFMLRNPLAHALGLSEDKVRVIALAVGGGFGGRTEPHPMDICAIVLARKSGQPVKITLTREEEFEATRVSHPIIMESKTGVMRDGTIVAKEVKTILDGGAYGSVGVAAPIQGTIFLSVDYKAPNIRLHAIRVYTNKVVAGARRGYTSPQLRYAECSHLDMIAEELGIDPVEFRLRNAVTTGYHTGTGLDITSCGLTECIEKAADGVGWKEKRGKLRKESRGVGMGVSSSLAATGYAPSVTPANVLSKVTIKLHTEGFATLYCGATDIGQGSATGIAMIMAEELGIGLDKVKTVYADTELCPFDAGTFGNRITYHVGLAAQRACADLKSQLFKTVAERIETNVADLEARDERIYVKGTPEKGMTFREAIWACQVRNGGQDVVGHGLWRGEDVETDVYAKGSGNYAPAYIFGTGAAEVEVDRETGKVTVPQFYFAQDIGKAIHPENVRGQLVGGYAMGLGYCLLEQLIIEKGRVLNSNLLDYKVPTVLDLPHAEVILVETEEPTAPYGAKGCGEGSIAPAPAAIANAIYDAVGVRIKSLPITPEKILKDLEELEKIK